jgi:pimeloyl-ACP methyl ester carboxylesterase
MTLALQSPEIVHDIVSVDNAPIDAALLSGFGKYVQGMKKIEEAGVTKQAEADKILAEYEESLVIRQFLLGNLYRLPNEKTQKFKVPLKILGVSLDNLGDFPFKDPEEVRFEKPALFVRGTQSKYVPDEALPVIGKFFPRFRLADIDAGHWVISEKPEDFRRGKLFAYTVKPMNDANAICL